MAAPKAAFEPKKVTIRPVPGGKPMVKPVRVKLSLAKHDTVEWHCTDPGAKWRVEFDPQKTPFEGHVFHPEKLKSGAIRVRPRKPAYYKYDVVVNGERLDPGVVVNP